MAMQKGGRTRVVQVPEPDGVITSSTGKATAVRMTRMTIAAIVPTEIAQRR